MLQKSVAVLFPGTMGESLARRIADVVPAAIDSHRGRFLLDVAYMRWWRARNTETSDKAVHYIQVDSSPQFGYDYECVYLQSIMKSDLPWVLSCSWRLAGLTPAQREAEPDFEAGALERLKRAILFHHPPPAQIGFGRAPLAHKFQAIECAVP